MISGKVEETLEYIKQHLDYKEQPGEILTQLHFQRFLENYLSDEVSALDSIRDSDLLEKTVFITDAKDQHPTSLPFNDCFYEILILQNKQAFVKRQRRACFYIINKNILSKLISLNELPSSRHP